MATTATDDQQMVLLLHWWLTERREQLGYSWDDLARITGSLPPVVEQWAAGEALPDYPQLQALAQHLGDANHPPGAEPLSDATPDVHDFVIAGNGLGIGKCVAIEDDTATVEYFDTIAHREEHAVPVADLRVVRLANQTRCYVYDAEADRWHMGRVRRLGDGDRMIELPDQEVNDPAQEHLFVRWARPVEDPTETLKQKGHETVFFRNQREPFVRALLKQRAASHGASGLLSSSIELYPHQTAVIRRVLEDPVQRYLLGDATGLGKTVEAGVIMRQFLIDHAEGRIGVFAPPAHHPHWTRALNEQFDMGALPGTVDLQPLDALPDTDAGAFDMLVVDAAHRVAQWADTDEATFADAAAPVHAADRLLLLSNRAPRQYPNQVATLLHLLDPDAYALDGADALTKTLSAREPIGHILRKLTAEADRSTLQATCANLRDALSTTDDLLPLTDELETALNAETPNDEAIERAIDQLRIPLKTRYELHPRMLRTSRADVDAVDGPRTPPEYAEFGMDLREEQVHELLETWRTRALDAGGDASSYARILQTLVETAGSDLALVADVASYRRTGELADRLAADLTDAERTRLTETPLFEGEADVLQEIEAAAQAEVDAMDLSHADWLVAFLEQKLKNDEGVPETFVVFTHYPSVAATLKEQLTEQLGYAAVALYHTDEEADIAEDEVRRFLEEKACRVLVCDRSGAGTIALPFVDHLIHYDQPWDALQMERRTGSCDRIGRRGRLLNTHVYLGPDINGSLVEAWYRLLDEGFDLFNTSLAPVQAVARERDLLQGLFEDGTTALDERIDTVRERVDAERRAADAQAGFERPEGRVHTDYFERLDALETDSRALYRDMDAWITKALRFHRSKQGYPDDMLRYQPDFNGKTLIPFDTILNRFLPKSNKPTTYHRSVAVASQDRPDVSANMFRIGHPFLDALVDYFRWDDRGRAYAIWRTSRQWNLLGQEDALYFRFEFVVDADVSRAAPDRYDAGQQAALQRRADAAFPPQFVTICTDHTGSVVTNEGLQGLLEADPERQQDGGSDENIKGDRLHVLDPFIDSNRWSSRCEEARDAARRALLQDEDVKAQQEAALRAVAADGSAGSAIAEALRESINHPSVRLDSVGVIVLSGDPLPVEEE